MRVTCPLCKKETTWKENPFRPFCSERCKLMDLGTWASEEYRIPGDRITLEEEPGEEKKEDSGG